MQEDRNKIGLALGSGGARGIAHLGVLEVLEREQIEIDIITGTSIGSLIGGFYACGVPLKYAKGLASKLQWEHITDVTFPRKGLIKGQKLLSFLELITKNKTFSELEIPFAAIACDIEHGEHVVLKDGSIARAIRASTSIPGIYEPFAHDGKLLVDGGVLDRVPVSTARRLGADIVIAVDVGIRTIDNTVKNIFDVIISTFDIMQNESRKYKKLDADILITPNLEGISSFDLDKAEDCIEAGYKAAENSLSEIKTIVKERVG